MQVVVWATTLALQLSFLFYLWVFFIFFVFGSCYFKTNHGLVYIFHNLLIQVLFGLWFTT